MNSLEPIMSDGLGNYEPKDVITLNGPGEGGRAKGIISWKLIVKLVVK